MTTPRNRTYTHKRLLQDLQEIKAVLEVEAQLMKALIKMSMARQDVLAIA
jgi:hypothetical protein